MTYQELQDYVRDRLDISTQDTDRVTQIQRILNSEYVMVAVEAETNLGTVAVSWSAGSDVMTFGVTVEKIKSIWGGANPPALLRPVSPSQFGFLQGEFFTTLDQPPTPKYYVVLKGATALSARLWPMPTTNETGTAIVVTKPTLMSAPTDPPGDVPEGWHPLIAERCIYKIALSEQNVTIAGGAKDISDVMLQTLVVHIQQRYGELTGLQFPEAEAGPGVAAELGQAATR